MTAQVINRVLKTALAIFLIFREKHVHIKPHVRVVYLRHFRQNSLTHIKDLILPHRHAHL